MSAAVAGEEPRHEIIIVKRHGGDHDDGHHGGGWKIAFADFMTAMMCFFLVMWLINAANEQTKAAVASYFNPVKLVDRNSSKKGLDDLTDGPPTEETDGEGATALKTAQDAETATAKEEASAEKANDKKTPDEKLFANPYAVLAEIASQTDVMANNSPKGDGGAQLAGPASGASGGESYRDPFAPDFWSQQVAASDTAEAGTPDPAGPSIDHPETAAEAPAVEPTPMAASQGPAVKPDTTETAAVEAKPEKAAAAEIAKPSAEAVKMAKEIKTELAQVFKPGEKIADGLSVVPTKTGVTISVTDQLDFGMFEIGSALPRREMILAMEKISRIIGEKPGAVTISGHTDGRPFKSKDYDNWRLSTARAHSAYYMLVRGGLDEKRVREVAGFADRDLKDKADPLSATNRRIEITLEVDG